MLVYVINKQGNPIMPCSVVKARRLLKSNKAKIVKRDIFTIQLLYNSSNYKQEINLGIDTGSTMVGISATTEKKELISAEYELRNDISDLLSDRRMYRRARRNRPHVPAPGPGVQRPRLLFPDAARPGRQAAGAR